MSALKRPTRVPGGVVFFRRPTRWVVVTRRLHHCCPEQPEVLLCSGQGFGVKTQADGRESCQIFRAFAFDRGARVVHDTYQKCIDACNVCAQACDDCASACLNEGDVKKLLDCIRLDFDCADICRTASAGIARGGPAVASLCISCAEVCDMCAEECEYHTHKTHCRVCAEARRKCAAECRSMASSLQRQPEALPA